MLNAKHKSSHNGGMNKMPLDKARPNPLHALRRFTRLSNAFSKKVVNHTHAVAIHFLYYNFVRIHKTLRITPAIACGDTNRLWGLKDIVRLLEQSE